MPRAWLTRVHPVAAAGKAPGSATLPGGCPGKRRTRRDAHVEPELSSGRCHARCIMRPANGGPSVSVGAGAGDRLDVAAQRGAKPRPG